MISVGSVVQVHPGPPIGRKERGAIAQLGEHLLCKQGVVGSIPTGSNEKGVGVRGRIEKERGRDVTRKKASGVEEERR